MREPAEKRPALSIFVSSPGDVSPERGVVRTVVNELSTETLATKGRRLELISWEDYGRPGVGADAQDVLNRNMAAAMDEADVCVFILWSRLGTPTRRAESGTAEEFRRSHERAVRSGFSRPRVMVYFKTEPPQIRTSEDARQLQALLAFREALPKTLLFWEFEDPGSLAEMIRSHLRKEISALDGPAARTTTPGMRVVDELPADSADEYAHVFVYGSLLDPTSLLSTVPGLGSTVDYLPARLRGYRRTWGVPQRKANIVDEGWTPVNGVQWLSMAIAPGSYDDTVSGAVIALRMADLRLLADREAHYAQRDVTDNVEALAASRLRGRVLTFVPREDAAGDRDEQVAVRRGYLDSVNNALTSLGFQEEVLPPREGEVVTAWDATTHAVGLWRDAGHLIKGLDRDLREHLVERRAVIRVTERRDAIATSVLPIVVSTSLYDDVRDVAERVVALSSGALRVLIDDPAAVRLSAYRDVDFEMARLDAAESDLTPRIARVDLTLHNGVLQVFEVNADSPGGMFHLDLLTRRQIAYSRERGIPIASSMLYPTCDAVVEAIGRRWYAVASVRKGLPREPRSIAIVERGWRHWATRSEFEHFRRRLTEELAPTEIYEPDELSYDDVAGLTASGRPIDVVYKRVLWSHLTDVDDPAMVRAETAMVSAQRAGRAVFVNSLGSRMAGNKLLMSLIQEPDFDERVRQYGVTLDDRDRQLIAENLPMTKVWDASDARSVSEVLARPEGFVLKSFNGYGGREVVVGSQVEAPERRRVFRRLLGQGYVVQEVVPHGRTIMAVQEEGVTTWRSRLFILGAYVVNGRCIAVEAKLSASTPISMNEGASRTAVLPAGGTSNLMR